MITIVRASSSGIDIQNRISVQNYVDPCIFGPYPKIFLDFLKIAEECYAHTSDRPAVRERAEYTLNDNLNVVTIFKKR